MKRRKNEKKIGSYFYELQKKKDKDLIKEINERIRGK